MPELPEVETIRADLERLVVGRKIISVKVTQTKPLRGCPETRFKKHLIGRRLVGVSRRAKILVLDLDSGDKLLIHLKMSGRLLYLPADTEIAKHTHLMFELDNGFELRFVDMRRFGYLKLVEGGDTKTVDELKKLGPEPLAADFSAEDFANLIDAKKTSRRSIKAILLDQTFLAGIGNLYADEMLYAAGVRPERPVASLTANEISRIYLEMRHILQAAIEHRGTSFDLYVDAQGRRGGYVEKLRVYGRAGEPCLKCGAPLSKSRIAGRGTHYCSRCQK